MTSASSQVDLDGVPGLRQLVRVPDSEKRTPSGSPAPQRARSPGGSPRRSSGRASEGRTSSVTVRSARGGGSRSGRRSAHRGQRRDRHDPPRGRDHGKRADVLRAQALLAASRPFSIRSMRSVADVDLLDAQAVVVGVDGRASALVETPASARRTRSGISRTSGAPSSRPGGGGTGGPPRAAAAARSARLRAPRRRGSAPARCRRRSVRWCGRRRRRAEQRGLGHEAEGAGLGEDRARQHRDQLARAPGRFAEAPPTKLLPGVATKKKLSMAGGRPGLVLLLLPERAGDALDPLGDGGSWCRGCSPAAGSARRRRGCGCPRAGIPAWAGTPRRRRRAPAISATESRPTKRGSAPSAA
jgi:hypothetical protein